MTASVHHSRLLIPIVLGSLAMIGPFAIDTIFPAFPAIEDDLSVGRVAMQQTISVYLLSYAFGSIFQGPMSDSWGRRPVILAGLAIFGLASLGAAFAHSFTMLLVWRGVQGASAGVGMVVGRAIIRDLYEGDDAQRLMSHVTMIFGIAPAIAPVIGGWILPWADWHGIFWFLVGFTLLLMVMTAFGLPETQPPARRYPMHPASLLRNYVAILRNGRFVLLCVCGGFNFGAIFLYISSAPAFVLDILKLNEQQFAWFFVPTIAGIVFGSFLNGRLAGRFSGRRTVNLGFLLCGIAATGNLLYNLLIEQPTAPWAVLPVMLNAIGVALVFPLLTLAMLDMYPRQRGAAASMQAFIGLGFNAVIAGVIAPLAQHSTLALMLTAGGFSLAAWALWRLYLFHRREDPLPVDTESVTPGPAERV
ncbi:MAG: multidrug effflux MFS transporter [Rhodanobacteraceae bacterium]|nr:multidrug effflux MFS transporter [Rhodanobacteraceae bacterium]